MKIEKTIDFTLPLLILLLMSSLSLIITIQANDLQSSISSYLSFVFTLNNLTSIILPFMLFAFFFISIKTTISIFDDSIETLRLYKIICYSFVPLLIHIAFSTINFLSFLKGVSFTSIEELYEIEYYFGLTLKDIQNISLIAWACVAICMIVLLKILGKKSIINSSIYVFLPIIIVLLFKLFFG